MSETRPVDWTALNTLLKERFMRIQEVCFPQLDWTFVESVLLDHPHEQKVLLAMEASGGEPALALVNKEERALWFFDCSPESPLGRRSLCYDLAAWQSRKANKPSGNVCDSAREMGVELLTEADYFSLQKLGSFDTKTSSWLHTPESLRCHGGALFGDHRFGRTFIYHNGAESYYAARGFRGKVRVNW